MFVYWRMKRKKILRRILWIVLLLFLLMNVSAFMHAYKFTHFSDSVGRKTNDPTSLSFGAKLKALFLGIDNPRPELTTRPSQPYETLQLQSNKIIECWYIRNDSSKGTVVLFHGYGGNKSSMLDKSDVFQKLGYSTLLVDFMGSGGSEGNQTTIGFSEAEQVRTVYEYLKKNGEDRIVLFGTSMGAVASLRSIYKYGINPNGIIIECPFGTLFNTTKARFKSMGVPTFPMANLLVFWGGIQNGFQGFSHDAEKYAKAVQCPSLLLYGEKDEKVSENDIHEIFDNMKGAKALRIYPNTGHENYLVKNENEWTADVTKFLSEVK